MYNTDLPTRADLPSTAQLLKSTAIALVTGAALLVVIILRSEYAIDPTGIGRLLGLTQMGEIKQQLSEEAALDAERPVVAANTEPVPAISETTAPAVATADVAGTDTVEKQAASAKTWTDEVSLQLNPGEAAEIKLVMRSGATVEFEWVADPGHLNSALHGDGTSGEATTYRNGRAETDHSDSLTAAFDGSHGWFWRNRSNVTVTMTLRVRGEYSEIKRVI